MSDHPQPHADFPAPTRRTVLRAAGLAALAGGGVAVLGACSADGDAAAPSTSAPTSSAPASSSAPAPSSAPASSLGHEDGRGAERSERSRGPPMCRSAAG